MSDRRDSRSRSRDRSRDRDDRRRDRSRSPGGDVRMAPGRDDSRNGGESGSKDENPGNNLFVRGLSHKTKDEDLRGLFDQFGKIKKCEIMYDPHTKESRGFAFVTFEHVEDADAAIKACNEGQELHGKRIIVEKARRGRARTPTPGRYYGPPKRSDDPAPPPYRGSRGYYDDRYRPYDDRGYGRYDDRDRRRDDRYDDRRRDDRYDDRRRDDRYDDRRRDDRR